jgi:hypothetical protein
MNNFTYPSETMQRKLEEAKAYLRARGKYVLDQGSKFHFSDTVQWDEYKKLAQENQLRAAA